MRRLTVGSSAADRPDEISTCALCFPTRGGRPRWKRHRLTLTACSERHTHARTHTSRRSIFKHTGDAWGQLKSCNVIVVMRCGRHGRLLQRGGGDGTDLKPGLWSSFPWRWPVWREIVINHHCARRQGIVLINDGPFILTGLLHPV